MHIQQNKEAHFHFQDCILEKEKNSANFLRLLQEIKTNKKLQGNIERMYLEEIDRVQQFVKDLVIMIKNKRDEQGIPKKHIVELH